MYSNDNYFTKEPYEDNGRCKIHPLSSEGMEAYLSKDSYNYNFIKTKKNPELLKDIEEEIKKEKSLREKLESKKPEISNDIQKKEEDLKEKSNCPNNKKSSEKSNDKSKNKMRNNSNTKKCNNLNKNSKGIENKGYNKKNENKKQSPGARLANTIEKLGKISGPVISNVNNDRGKLWEYPAPYHS